MNEVKQMIARNQIREAMKALTDMAAQQDGDMYNELVGMTGKWEDVQSRERRGLLTFQEANLERARISASLLELSDKLSVLAESLGSPATRDKWRILFLAANPTNSGRLRLDQELREIRESLQRSGQRDRYELESRQAVRTQDLRRAMLEVEPHIVHFSGHGVVFEAGMPTDTGMRGLYDNEFLTEEQKKGYSGGIVLENQLGEAQVVRAEALASLFSLFNSVQCVVLNACHSQMQSEAIIAHVPYVIGMNAAIPDATAVTFAAAFYDGLGAGKDIPFSFKLARTSVELDGLPGAHIPELKQRA
ncbi:MAG: CHAT domain-containing protein [Bacteroidia bacterium]|nr:CHAT domain-containing protein [Bacteroidia bacterium]